MFKTKKFIIPLFFIFFFVFSTPVLAKTIGAGKISWTFLILELFGGLAFFLYGMEKMSLGMKQTAGNQMRVILAALTKNRVIALMVGAFVTMVIQSSSATTVMLVSFVQANLMSFGQTIAVILGADIGTTVTAQLIAFKLTDYAILMIVIGVLMRMTAKNDNIKNIGEIILGFGILFYGMKLMSDAMKPLRTHDEIISILKSLENPLLGVLVGTLFTALIQSSSAFTGIIIVLAQQGLVSLEAGIPMIFGANVGTCVTAGLASIGTSRDAKRVALAHVMFRIVGLAIFISWIPTFADFIRHIGSYFNSGAARQIANAHTFFNVSLGLLFLPFTTLFEKLIIKILPDKEIDDDLKIATWHLDENSISTPAIGIELARTEASRMAKLLNRMLRAIIIPFISDPKLITKEKGLSKKEASLLVKEIPTRDEFFPQLSLIEGLDMREDKIDFLEEKIGDYLLKIARQGLSEEQSNEVYGMISIVKDMESIGDIIHRNMIPLIAKKHALESDFSEEGKEELLIYHQKVCRQVQLLRDAFSERDLTKAKAIMEQERIFLDLESKYRIQHLERILQKRKDSVETHEIHMDLMDLMKQIIVYTSHIAETYVSAKDQTSENDENL
ncbi:MAG: Na/Pi cotransporter family protein [Desulfobacterales bacterium]|nr:Na/Pi cotransporter family protein [Desulfobacteraceae bacterium]MBT7086256.1 Na/Pi cotransporter family protein [Desulfobacterales bacterium]MBT7697140.1 Na/Pi cotransporter family protein [Desulfobacterales bacterium]